MARRKPIYSFRNALEKSPSVLSHTIFMVVNFIAAAVFVAQHVEASVQFGVLMVMGESALFALLNLFVVQPNTQTNAAVAATVAKAEANKETEIVQYLAENSPPVPPKVVEDVAAGTSAKKVPAKKAAKAAKKRAG